MPRARHFRVHGTGHPHSRAVPGRALRTRSRQRRGGLSRWIRVRAAAASGCCRRRGPGEYPAADVPRPEPASLLEPESRKVVARYWDGLLLRGYTNDFHPSKAHLHLTSTPTAGAAALVPLSQLKALFFVKDFAGDPELCRRKAFRETANRSQDRGHVPRWRSARRVHPELPARRPGILRPASRSSIEQPAGLRHPRRHPAHQIRLTPRASSPRLTCGSHAETVIGVSQYGAPGPRSRSMECVGDGHRSNISAVIFLAQTTLGRSCIGPPRPKAPPSNVLHAVRWYGLTSQPWDCGGVASATSGGASSWTARCRCPRDSRLLTRPPRILLFPGSSPKISRADDFR